MDLEGEDIDEEMRQYGVYKGRDPANEATIEAIRQKADTYIHTNPLGVADWVAAIKALDICDSAEGWATLKDLNLRAGAFRQSSKEGRGACIISSSITFYSL